MDLTGQECGGGPSTSSVEESETDNSRSSRSGSSGFLDEDSNSFSGHFRAIDHAMSPPVLSRDSSVPVSNKSGQMGQNSLSLQIMSLKLLGKFLGLLHFYPQWTLLSTGPPGPASEVPGGTSRAQSNMPHVNMTSPVLRLAEQFGAKRNMFYNITLDMDDGASTSTTTSTRTPGGLPIYGWLMESKKKRVLISTVPWIIEFLRMSKYDLMLYSAAAATGTGNHSNSTARSQSHPSVGKVCALNLYENVIEELLSIESEFVHRMSGVSNSLSTTE